MLVVVRVRGCDVDNLDGWVSDELAVGAVSLCVVEGVMQWVGSGSSIVGATVTGIVLVAASG